jgi:hypothetical protein
MRAQYYVKLESTSTFFVGPFASRAEAEAAVAAHREVYARTAAAGFVTRGVHTATEARAEGLRAGTLLGDRMPTDSADFAELMAYATMLR